MPSTPQSPRPAQRRRGRRPGRSETQAAIEEAARALFAESGYAGTSIRAIAARADVDPALIYHYFDTKDGLFWAVLDFPIDPGEVIGQALNGNPHEAGTRMAEVFLTVWDDPDTGPAMLAFLRRALTDPATSVLLQELAETQIIGRAAAALLPDVEPDEARARMAMAWSQLLGVVVARQALGLEPLARMSREEVVARLTPVLATHLAGPTGSAADSGLPHSDSPTSGPPHSDTDAPTRRTTRTESRDTP